MYGARGRIVHSGAYGGAVPNPTMAIAEILACALAATARSTMPGSDDRLLPPRRLGARGLRQLHVRRAGVGEGGRTSIAPARARRASAAVRPAWARPTWRCHGIFGGFTRCRRSKTVIPASAPGKLPCRLVSRPATGRRVAQAGRSATSATSARPRSAGVQADFTVLVRRSWIDVTRRSSVRPRRPWKKGFGRETTFIALRRLHPRGRACWRTQTGDSRRPDGLRPRQRRSAQPERAL